MNVQEINNKIADLEKRSKNPSLPASAVTSLNKMIADLKAQMKAEPSKPAEPTKAEPKKAEPKPKYETNEVLIHKDSGKTYRVIILAVTGWTGKEHRYDIEFLDDNLKPMGKYAKSYDSALSRTDKGKSKTFDTPSPKKAEPKAKPEPKKAEPKAKGEEKHPEDEDDYCDKVIKQAKERRAKAKANAKKRANEPKKTPATKNKEKVEKTTEKVAVNVEKRAEKGQVSKAEILKLIAEYEDAIKKLKKVLAKL
jgi:hypothetical protein